MLGFFRRYWHSMIVVAVIIYATWIPHPIPDESIPSVPHVDKLIHAIMFGGLAGAIMFDNYRNGRRPNSLGRHSIYKVVILAAFMALVDELVQGILPIGRPSDFLDLLADWAGIIIAAATAPPVIRRILH